MSVLLDCLEDFFILPCLRPAWEDRGSAKGFLEVGHRVLLYHLLLFQLFQAQAAWGKVCSKKAWVGGSSQSSNNEFEKRVNEIKMGLKGPLSPLEFLVPENLVPEASPPHPPPTALHILLILSAGHTQS
jgi:hypothetical protein